MNKSTKDVAINVCIVILHFNDYSLTNNYIKNIKLLNWGILTYKIIIVDNCSVDGSGNILQKTYIDDPYVDVILSQINIGFAKGNNLGISYAHDNYHCDLVVVSNSDILIEDKDFYLKLWDIYTQNNAVIIGPDIYSVNKKIHQSPISRNTMTLEQLRQLKKSISRKIKYLKIIKILHVYDIISYIKRKLLGKVGSDSYNYDLAQKNVVLQGAFFVMTREYLNKHPEGLFPGTFLYMEEHILAYICKKEKLDILYDPRIKVIHLDGYTTLKQKSDKCSKYLFELRETLKSCDVFEDFIKHNDYISEE